MKIKYLLMAAFILPCAMFTACGGDDGGDEPIPPPSTDPSSAALLTDVEAEKYIDASYMPTLSEIQKTWAGEYEGWDATQANNGHVGNTKIKRLLTLLPNKQYVNIIQGVILEGKGEYVDFEHEKGSYYYNPSTCVITYTVESDSVLDYSRQKFNGYKGKKYYDRTEGNYTEKVQFSTVRDGQRSWITHDTYLQSLTNKTINIAFMMVTNVDQQERK